MFKKIFSSELGKGAIILFITMNIFNFLNFLFHFSMGRILGPVSYGTLAVLMSIIYIYNIPTEAIQNLISNYTSRLNAKKENGKIKVLIFKALKKGFGFALTLFLISAIFGFFLSKFLNINFWLILFTNIFIFSAFSSPIVRGVLQGRKKFGALGISLILESILKLIFAISLVIFGFKVFGAMMGVLLGVFSGMIFAFYFNMDILKEKEEKTYFKDIYPQSIRYFVTMFVIFLIFSLDIILAKGFFSEELAGQYAVLSMLGKMIFLGTIAVSKAMFPLTSEKQDNHKDARALFKKSILIISTLCIIAIGVYLFFPKIITGVFYGEQYLSISPFLVYSALAYSFLSISNLFLVYGLATNRLKKTNYLFIFIVIEILLLSLFHKDILEFILAFMVSNIIMFIGSLFFIKHR